MPPSIDRAFDMKQPHNHYLLGACLAIILGAGLASFANAEDATLDSVQVQGDLDTTPTEYRGTINRIPSGGRSLIVDDTLLHLDNVVIVNGQSWSQARIAGKLKEGMEIGFELKQGPMGRLPVIVALNILR